LSVKWVCFHRNEQTDKFSGTTIVDTALPDDKFLRTFAAACVELTEKPQVVRTDELRSSTQEVFEHSLREDHGEWTLHHIDMLKRDQIVEAMLRSRDYYIGFADGRKRGKFCLRKRKREHMSRHDVETHNVSKWMHETMSTHAHLLPTH